MSTEKLLSEKPTNSLRKLNSVSAFEQENPIFFPKGTFGSIQKTLYLFNGYDVVASCYIEGNKDIGNCILVFPKIEELREIIERATNYALDDMGMQESFVFVEKKDKKTMQILSTLGYESLGEEGEQVAFVKDAEIKKEGEAIWRL